MKMTRFMSVDKLTLISIVLVVLIGLAYCGDEKDGTGSGRVTRAPRRKRFTRSHDLISLHEEAIKEHEHHIGTKKKSDRGKRRSESIMTTVHPNGEVIDHMDHGEHSTHRPIILN